jgi:hypothetical protein
MPHTKQCKELGCLIVIIHFQMDESVWLHCQPNYNRRPSATEWITLVNHRQAQTSHSSGQILYLAYSSSIQHWHFAKLRLVNL